MDADALECVPDGLGVERVAGDDLEPGRHPPTGMSGLDDRRSDSKELLDEESLAVLPIPLAVSLEFGFGCAKTVHWWAGLVAESTALVTLIVLFRLRRTHAWLVHVAGWGARTQRPSPPPRGSYATTSGSSPEKGWLVGGGQPIKAL